MADQHSFDIISRVDFQEVDNAVNQSVKEIRNRYDFKGTKSSVEFNKTDKKIKIVADDDLKLRNLQDILKTRAAARGIPVKALKFETEEKAFEGTLRQDVTLISGIPIEKAKIIVKEVKDHKFKVQVSIQGEEVRVSSKSKDELQVVMAFLKQLTIDIPLQFSNFR